MLISPDNIELNKIVKKRKFNFDTPNRLYGNLIILATDDYDDYNASINSQLFKPQQLFSMYTPRKVKPLNRSYITYIQKDIYADLKDRTNGFLKIGKAMLTSYAGRNLLYNIVPEYYETEALYKKLKGNSLPAVHLLMEGFFQNMLQRITNDIGYTKTYLIFSLTKYIDNFRSEVQIDTTTNTAPIIEFLKSLRKKKYDASNYKNIDRIFFYCPSTNAIVAMDPQDPDIIDHYLVYFDKINRLNNSIKNPNELKDIPEDDVPTNITLEDTAENTKEQIKDVVLNKVAKSLKANLTDYDAADTSEQGIINSIDDKVTSYLNKPENTKKSFDELVNAVSNDKEVTNKSIEYVEKKQLGQKQLNQLSKNLGKELDVIENSNSLKDIADKTEAGNVESFEPEKLSHADIDARQVLQYNSLKAFDNAYNTYQAPKDLLAIITSFSDQKYSPLTLDKYDLVDSSDEFNLKKTLSVRYRTINNKTVSFKIDIPDIVNDHCIKVNGNLWIIQKQKFRLPIVKTKSDRVEIATNYTKITCSRTAGQVSRHNAYLKKDLIKYKMNPYINVEFGDNSELLSSYLNDFEFEELSSFLTKITTTIFEINTDRPTVESEFELMDYPETFTITKDMTPVGFETHGDSKNLLFIKDGVLYTAIAGKDFSIKKRSDSLFNLIMTEILHEDINNAKKVGKSFMYSTAKFLTVTYPMLVLCGIYGGLRDVLTAAQVRWKFSKVRLPYALDMVEVKFKDGYFYYQYSDANTLLLNAFNVLNTPDYNFNDFDSSRPYIDYCTDVMSQTYAAQTTEFNLSKMIDPITADVLTQLKLPTDIISLLVLANKMLTNNSYITQDDLTNYRIRGNELIYANLYGILANAVEKYQNMKANGSNKETLAIKQNQLIQTLISQENINGESVLNPLLEVESSAACSSKGYRGIALPQAYTLELRNYDSSMNGFLSANATPYSGSVGISRSLTYNPKISTIRGFVPTIDQKTLTGENRLSTSELMSFTTATRADPPRIAMEVGQAKHTVPTVTSTIQLIGSGADRTIPYMLSDKFCFKAKDDGVMDSIDEKNKIAILHYNDGTYDAINLKETMWNNSNSGFYISQTFALQYKEGERFNKNDVVAYNPSFFTGKGKEVAYMPGCLAKIAITAGDFVFEDSTFVTEKLCKLCSSYISMARGVALGKNSIVHNMVKVGDEVKVNDELINFTTSYDDPTTTAFLQNLMSGAGGKELAKELGNEKVYAKDAGRISNIEIYYNEPFEELNSSLQAIIRAYQKQIEERKKVLEAKHIHESALDLVDCTQVKATKIKGTEFDGVLIIFYTTKLDPLVPGDKITYSVALKGVITTICPDKLAPFSDFRPNEEICGLSAVSGISNRATMDVYPQMYGNKLLIELGRWIHKTWNE